MDSNTNLSIRFWKDMADPIAVTWRPWWVPYPFIFMEHDPCVYCGRPSEGFDHLDPISHGGRRLGNMAPACMDCNSRRGTQPIWKFLLWRMATTREYSYACAYRVRSREVKYSLDWSHIYTDPLTKQII